ncbi:MAG TPA: hypothetical protein VHB79_30680 [Polyangiaceae bacterium]|nr:hypothetical protein [Polyangiaceae bacterium]
MYTSINACASSGSVASCGASVYATSLSPEERLLALTVYQQAAQINDSRASIELSSEQLQKLREQVKESLDKARESKKDAGFWGDLSEFLGSDLGTVLIAAAAIAAAVVTGGAAVAVLAVIACAASLAASHAKELGIPESVAVGIAVVATVASLCCGNAGGLVGLAKALQVAGAACKVGGAACGAASAKYEHDAANQSADARAAQGEQTLTNADMDDAFANLSTAVDRKNQSAAQASAIQRQTAASNQAILDNWGASA